MAKIDLNELQDLEELLSFQKSEIKNLDLLYKYLNIVYSELMEKKEQLTKDSTDQERLYIEGQIAGFKYAHSVVEAFFDH